MVRRRPEEPPRAALATPGRLARLARSDDPGERLSAALSSRTPADTLEALVTDPDTRVRQAVAANPATPPQTLDALAGDIDISVRSALAAAAPTTSLRATLMRDTSAAVRAELLRWHSRRCEGRSLDTEAAAAALALCSDADPAVAAVAARLRSADTATPPAALAALGAHPDDEARRNAAAHHRCPTETVGRLAGDPCLGCGVRGFGQRPLPASRPRRRRWRCVRVQPAGRAPKTGWGCSAHRHGPPTTRTGRRCMRLSIAGGPRAQSKQAFGSAEDAARFVDRMLADRLLQTRYGAVCGQLQSSATVRFDTKMQMFAGRSEGTEIGMHPKAAPAGGAAARDGAPDRAQRPAAGASAASA